MTDSRNPDRLVRAFLSEGVEELSDHVYDSVRDQLHHNRQRVVIGPLKMPIMDNNVVRVGIAAVVVALAIVVAVKVLPGSKVGEPTATASTIPTPTSSIRPMPAGQHGELEPGTYVAGDPFSLRVTFTLPAGWLGSIVGPYLVDLGWAQKQGGISFSIVNQVYADPCHPEQGFLDPPPGPSVDDLAMALANMPGIVVMDVADASVDGHSGTQLTMAAPDSFANCNFSNSRYWIWHGGLSSTRNMNAGERDRVWILDVAGTRLVILASDERGYTDTQRAELQAIFDSIHIEPAN